MSSVSGVSSSASATALKLLQQASQVLASKPQTTARASSVSQMKFGSAVSPSASDAILQMKSLVAEKVVAKDQVASEVYNAGASMTPEEIRAHNEAFTREVLLPKPISETEFQQEVLSFMKEEFSGADPVLSNSISNGRFSIMRPNDVPELEFDPTNYPVYSSNGLIIGATGTSSVNPDAYAALKNQGIEVGFGGLPKSGNGFLFLYW